MGTPPLNTVYRNILNDTVVALAVEFNQRLGDLSWYETDIHVVCELHLN